VVPLFTAALALVITSAVFLLVGLAGDHGTNAILAGSLSAIGALILLWSGVVRRGLNPRRDGA
jgi:hypothetical protein